MSILDLTLDEATVMTAVVVQEGLSQDSNTTRVQVQLADENSENALSVFVDGSAVDFSNPFSLSKEFYSMFPTTFDTIRIKPHTTKNW